MTITFYCPNCDALIAFDDKHIGKRARCQTCGLILVIPAGNDEVPQVIESEVPREEPVPGFYHALLVDTWKIFIDPRNVTSLTFVVAIVCFKFFLAEALCCINYIMYMLAWGWLFGFYLNIIYETAFDIDKLPEIFLGTFITFVWQAMKPFLIFLFTLFVVQLPFFIILAVFRSMGLTSGSVWQLEFGWRLIPQMLFVAGLFFFPIAILTVAVGRDISLLGPIQLLKPIRRAFAPYLVVAGLLLAFCITESFTMHFTAAPVAVTVGHLMLNLLVQLIAIFAMRAIGLFYRHYNCHLAW